MLKPAQCKLFGKECTPEHPIGALMVSSEGSCAAYYSYQHRKASELVQMSDRLGLQMTSAPPKIRFRDPQVDMAHGAGGKASRRLVEGLFAPDSLRRLDRTSRATPLTSISAEPASR